VSGSLIRQTPGRALLALNSELEALVPTLSWVRRLREGGPSADTSTIFNPQAKPIKKRYADEYAHGLEVLNPFRPVREQEVKYLRQPSARRYVGLRSRCRERTDLSGYGPVVPQIREVPGGR
jgi:hypothetical protein